MNRMDCIPAEQVEEWTPFPEKPSTKLMSLEEPSTKLMSLLQTDNLFDSKNLSCQQDQEERDHRLALALQQDKTTPKETFHDAIEEGSPVKSVKQMDQPPPASGHDNSGRLRRLSPGRAWRNRDVSSEAVRRRKRFFWIFAIVCLCVLIGVIAASLKKVSLQLFMSTYEK